MYVGNSGHGPDMLTCIKSQSCGLWKHRFQYKQIWDWKPNPLAVLNFKHENPNWKFLCYEDLVCKVKSSPSYLPLWFYSLCWEWYRQQRACGTWAKSELRTARINTTLLAVEAGNAVWEHLPQGLTVSQVLSLFPESLMACVFLCAVHLPSFPPWTPAWLWRDRGACELGHKARAWLEWAEVEAGRSEEQEQETHGKAHWNVSTCTLQWR